MCLLHVAWLDVGLIERVVGFLAWQLRALSSSIPEKRWKQHHMYDLASEVPWCAFHTHFWWKQHKSAQIQGEGN